MSKKLRTLLAVSLVLAAGGILVFGCASTLQKDRNQTLSSAPAPKGGKALACRAAFNEADSGQRPPDPWETTGMDTELWVIEKSADTDAQVTAKENSPQLRAIVEEKEIPLPLEHTDVKAQISGYVATVDVLQKYHNPYSDKIEAVYVFPLPQSAAVTDFVMMIGERKIRGIIREKEEAKKIYEQAKSQGYRASLLTQERPNIFEQKVANIEPGKRIDIKISFFNPLQYKDGEFEFVFPTVAGPRFNPPGSTDGIGAVGRGSRGASGRTTEIPYLKPGEKSGHDIAISVAIDAGLKLEKIHSPSHVIKVEKENEAQALVTLSPHDRVPNKDFILRYQTAGEKVKTALMVHKGKDGNYFSLLLQPPADLTQVARMPREMVFVLDCSGSMHGRPIAKAKEAMRRCLRSLDKDDTFQIIRFSENASTLGPHPIPATRKNVEKGLKYLESLKSSGGTMMIEGIKAALDFPHEEGRMRIVSFMTDGYIGNEAEILGAINNKIGTSRIFSFGVGSSVNRYLLERMAKIGRGAVAYVGLYENAGEEVDLFYQRVAHPALADIEIDWGELKAANIYPQTIPDLFVGRPIVITGRFKGNPNNAEINIKGYTGREKKTVSINVNADAYEAHHPGIRSVWARWKIADLSDRETYAASEKLRDEILATSLNYGLLSRYTAFLAVDSSAPTKGDHGYTVDVPVPVPDGVRYETTVEE